MTTPVRITMAHAALSASTQTTGEVAVWYVASARLAFTVAAEELEALERVLIARERELAHAANPLGSLP